MRVTDCGDGKSPPELRVRPGEERAQQDGLRGGGVLILIQQHHPEARSHDGTDGWCRARQLHRAPQLVGVLDQPEPALQFLVVRDETENFETFVECSQGFGDD